MNLIPKICEMLGVEVGEEFKLENSDRVIYKFKGSGLYEKKNTVDFCWCICNDLTLRDILVGIGKIEKLPFEPKYGEEYYRIFIHTDGDITINMDTWSDWAIDYMCKYCGNCFRTRDEAEKHKYEIYEKLTGKKWEEK